MNKKMQFLGFLNNILFLIMVGIFFSFGGLYCLQGISNYYMSSDSALGLPFDTIASKDLIDSVFIVEVSYLILLSVLITLSSYLSFKFFKKSKVLGISFPFIISLSGIFYFFNISSLYFFLIFTIVSMLIFKCKILNILESISYSVIFPTIFSFSILFIYSNSSIMSQYKTDEARENGYHNIFSSITENELPNIYFNNLYISSKDPYFNKYLMDHEVNCVNYSFMKITYGAFLDYRNFLYMCENEKFDVDTSKLLFQTAYEGQVWNLKNNKQDDYLENALFLQFQSYLREKVNTSSEAYEKSKELSGADFYNYVLLLDKENLKFSGNLDEYLDSTDINLPLNNEQIILFSDLKQRAHTNFKNESNVEQGQYINLFSFINNILF